MTDNIPRPSNKLYGVTHELDGQPRIIEPQTVKVGIGLPKGPAIHVYIDLDDKWVLLVGYGETAERHRFDHKRDAQKAYRRFKATAEDRKYPARLPYFTFSHMGAEGHFEPDWDIIESHGSVPTEISIIFVRDDPFQALYVMYGQDGKKCYGDGRIGARLLSMAQSREEKALAAGAKARGENYFPVTDGCFMTGCKYAKSADGFKPAPCGTIGRLFFQLIDSPRLGGTAVFTTTGYKSISQIWSALEIFRSASVRGESLGGFVAGIPLKMVLRPYRTRFQGKTATQYAVGLEYRASSARELRESLIRAGVDYQIAGDEPIKKLQSAEIKSPPAEPLPAPEAAEISAEFSSGSATPAAGEDIQDTDPNEEISFPEFPDDDLPPPGELQQNPIKPPFVEIQQFYKDCRAKGMTDQEIYERIGVEGFEELSEITAAAFPDLKQWLDNYAPKGDASKKE